MATVATTLIAAAFLLLLLAEAAPFSTEGCTDQLISFSACLSYVSDPPNNLADSASDKCCDAISSAVESGAALCLCYFVRYPNMLGFPLNTTRLLSLSSACTPPPSPSPSPYAATTHPPFSLNFLCSASPVLPPLNSAATLGFSEPSSGGSRGGGGRGGGGGGGGREEEGSSRRKSPKFGGRSPRSGWGSGSASYFPTVPNANGPLAPSTHFCHTNAMLMLLSPIVAILVTLSLLNTV